MGNGLTRYRGAKRDEVAPTYWLSTKDVTQFLQERIDIIVATLRKTNPEYSNLENIPVTVAGVQASHGFCTLVVILPPEALESESSNVGKDVPYVFKQRDEEMQLKLIPKLENLFQLYIYTKEDKKEFKSNKFIEKMNLNRRVINTLVYFSVPRYRKVESTDDGNGREHVMFFIDPIKVFCDMLTEEGDRSNSTSVLIDGIQKIRNGEYKFHVKKLRKKHEKKNDDKFIKELEGLLRGKR